MIQARWEYFYRRRGNGQIRFHYKDRVVAWMESCMGGWIEGGPGINDLRRGFRKASGAEGTPELQVTAVTVSMALQKAPAAVGGRYGCTHVSRLQNTFDR